MCVPPSSSWAMQAPSRLRGSRGLTARHGSAWATNSSWLTRTLAGRPGSGAGSGDVGPLAFVVLGPTPPVHALATSPAPPQGPPLVLS
jgi:hypothetical protein